MFNREPVLWMALLRAIVVCGAAFGLQLSAAQVAGIYLVMESLLSLITRQSVTPVVKP